MQMRKRTLLESRHCSRSRSVGVAAGCGGGDESTATTEAPAATTEAATSEAATTEAATSEAATTEAAAEVTKIGIVAPEKANDYGWNQQGVESAQAAADAAGAEVEVADGVGYENITPVLRQPRRATARADHRPGQRLQHHRAEGRASSSASRSIDLRQARQHEPGARRRHRDLEPAGRVPRGHPRGEDDEDRHPRHRRCPPTTRTGTSRPAASSPARGASTRTSKFRSSPRSARPSTPTPRAASASPRASSPAGADVVFGMGDGSSFGMLQAVETAKPPARRRQGLVHRRDRRQDRDRQEGRAPVVGALGLHARSSSRRSPTSTPARSGTQDYDLTVANGISLLQTDKVPAEVWAEIETAQQGIADGSDRDPPDADPGDVDKLIGSRVGREAPGRAAAPPAALPARRMTEDRNGGHAEAWRPPARPPSSSSASRRPSPASWRTTTSTWSCAAGEVHVPARRERSRQVHADEHPLGDGAAGRGRIRIDGSDGRDRLAAGARSSSGSAWSTSTRRSCRRCPCSRT